MTMRLTFLTALLTLSLSSCGENGNEAPLQEDAILTCSPQSIEAEAVETQYLLAVTCSNGEWTAFANDDCKEWVTAQVTNASLENGQVAVTVKANHTTEPRSGNVTVKAGQTRLTVPVTQKTPLSVSENQLYSNSSGETFTLTVTASGEWSVQAHDGWLTVEKTDNRTVTVTTQPNDALQSRSGSFSITSGQEEITVNVYQESAEDRNIQTPEGYRLVWHDEFDEGTTLSSEWTHEVQEPGWVNNELQTYVNGQADGKRVTELADGKLNIHCFKGSDGKIYSGRVYANLNSGWLHGYFEARIMLPQGKGTWPAFWMMPVNNDFGANPWPNCGEIDIMEEVGADPNIVSSSIHCAAYNHTIGTQKTASRDIGTAESEFHVYACEWTEDYLRFFVDGEELMEFRNEGTGKDVWPFTYAFYPILNLAWGGNWGGYKGVDESALPVTMKVDYVRVFQKKQ